jgi:hypothetical protein
MFLEARGVRNAIAAAHGGESEMPGACGLRHGEGGGNGWTQLVLYSAGLNNYSGPSPRHALACAACRAREMRGWLQSIVSFN